MKVHVVTMRVKSKLFFICLFFAIQYVVLFLMLYALREIVFERVTNTILTGAFLIIYLMTSYFTVINFITGKLDRHADLKEQIEAYRNDGIYSARRLADIRQLIEDRDHEEASRVINSFSMESTLTESETTGTYYSLNSSLSKNEKSLVEIILDKYEAKCASKEIEFRQSIRTEKLDNYFSSKELMSILGNLLDNAIEAIVELESISNQNLSQKWISIEINASKSLKGQKSIEILVSNSGQTLQEDQAERIFTAGVTSKSGDDHGYGLAVVMDIVRKLGGTTRAIAHPETEIQVIVPEA